MSVLDLVWDVSGFERVYLQGLLGALLIKLNAAAAVYRRHSFLHEWPVAEVAGMTALTAAVSYLVRVLHDL